MARKEIKIFMDAKEAAAALKEAHIPYRVHGEYCISVNNDDYSTAVEAFFRNDVSFQPE